MATKFNFTNASETPIAQAATETMVNAFEKKQQDSSQTADPNVSNNSADSSNHLNTSSPSPAKNDTATINNTPSLVNSAAISTPIEHLASRRIQMQSDFNGAAVQAINLKTFPEAGNWKLEEIVRKFNLTKSPGTPKLTKGALAEMLLFDAVSDIYEKICIK